ncbi:hypothetical protein G6F22_010622 [Rhizopus arrhizus]|nr:hypothetical protein G6F22_010622 [Rhizopus arrhizus]
MMAFPDILLAISLVAALGPSLINVVIALGIVYTPRLARIVRASTLVIRELPFVEAARALGVPTWRIVTVHVLRNLVSPILVQGTFIFAYAILAEAGLSFQGVGVSPDIPTWGTMINAGQQYMGSADWIMIFPGIAIVLSVLSLQLVGDGLRDVLDPRLRKELRDGIAKSVDGVTFDLARGETLAIVGESGSGKSVTSLSIMGLLPKPAGRIEGGKILYRDRQGTQHDLARATPTTLQKIRGAEIAMIFQEPMTSLNPLYTVGDQIAEAVLQHEGGSYASAIRRARDMLERVEIPAADRRVNEYPHQMSGGMRQRVMIALALACNPAVLIADEPTTALDVTVQAQILDLLRRLQKEMNMSILFITHNLGVVAEIAHRVAVMYAGRVVEDAGVYDLFEKPTHPYTRGLLSCLPTAALLASGERLRAIPGNVPSVLSLPAGCTFAPRCELAADDCRAAVPELIAVQPEHRARCIKARNAPVVRAVDGVSFDMPRNTIVGLVGESGSGKTTTGRALLRLFAPTAGRILFDGQDITTLNEKQMLPWRRRMQIVFQDPYASLNPRMTVAEILGEALDTHRLAQHRRSARIGELLERVGLNADHSRRYPHEFSGGQRQRIGIARALAVEPDFIVADEPVTCSATWA